MNEVYVAEDLLPEKMQYRDEGCELAPSCLHCPFPRCRYDEERSGRQVIKEIRNEEIVKCRFINGVKIGELAKRYDVSKRTIHRILRRRYR